MSFDDDIREFADYLEGKYVVDINDGRIIPDGDLHTIRVDHMSSWIIYYWCSHYSVFYYGLIRDTQSDGDDIFSVYKMKDERHDH